MGRRHESQEGWVYPTLNSIDEKDQVKKVWKTQTDNPEEVFCTYEVETLT